MCTWKIGRDAGNAHDGTFGGRVAPRFIIARENAQMATSHELLVVQSKEGVRGAQKFRMEHNLEKKSIKRDKKQS